MVLPITFITLIWVIKIAEIVIGVSFINFGIYPREIKGLIGIISLPLIHADWNHLLSNTLPILFLGTGIYYFYPLSSKKVILIIYLFTGILVWLFARPTYHIGASGLIYGLAAFLFFSGLIRRDKRAITLALLVTFFYGSLIWGVLPVDPGISWEGHLFGALTGIICAFIFRKSDPYKRYDWEDEPDDEEKPEISYDKN
ncbi:MAG: rhombosortase [Ignavibacteria bacterium RBG_13_36_8]|nr:MAG: rhombosortase [Ignavibacteria bacterium RBG_13_36_8]